MSKQSTQDEAYLQANRELWNKRTPIHLDSDFYDLESFKAGKTSLQDIELGLLGDLKGKEVLHLQCHFGQDTLSLARMGAKVTGLDLSDVAIAEARKLNDELGLDAKFVCGNVLEMDQHLNQKYDLVFTTYGVIGWLPDLGIWANLIKKHLKPGGRLMLIEFHPVVWMYDPKFTKVAYSYFNKEAIIEAEEGTYANKESGIKVEAYGWNHSFGEVLGTLLKKGFQINHFEEYDYSPYDIFDNPVKVGDRYYVKDFEEKLPLVYSVVASL